MGSHDYIELPNVPIDEPCAQVGDEHYRHDAMVEYMAMKGQIERVFGPIPDGVVICHRLCLHDFGSYLEIRAYYEDEQHMEFVLKMDNEFPYRWDEQAKEILKRRKGRPR